MVSHATSRLHKMLHGLKSAAISMVLSNAHMTGAVMLVADAATFAVIPRVVATSVAIQHVVAIPVVSLHAAAVIPTATVAVMVAAVS